MGRLKEIVWTILLLVVFIGVNEVALTRWCRQDTRPLAWDESIHTRLAVEYRTRIRTEGFRAVFHPAYFNYPPLYHLMVGSVLQIPRDVADAGAVVNGIVLAALMVAIFLLGKTFLGPWEGLVAAFIFSCYPAVVGLTRPPMIDLTLTLWVTLGFYTLYWSDGFLKPGWSALFGFVSGLGMLTKWSYAIYLLVPFGLAFFRSIRLRTSGKAWLAVGVAALVMSPWYVENFFPMMAMFHRVTSLPPAGMAELTGWRNALWYFFALGEGLNLYFLLLLIPGLFVSLWRPKLTGVFIWFASGLVLFSIIRNHNVRYAVPVLPAAALLSVAWLPEARRIALGLVFAGAVAFFVFQQFLPERRVMTTVASVPMTVWSNQEPRAEDWKHSSVIQRVEELKPKDRFCRIVVLSNYPQFHSTTLNLSAEMRGAKDISFAGPSQNRWLDFKDFVLVKTGSLGPVETLGNIQPDADLVLRSMPVWFKKAYREVGRYNLPDHSEAVLYQADPEPVKGLSADSFQISLTKLSIGHIDLENVEVSVVPISPAQTAVGRFKELRVRASKIRSKDLTFENADLRLLRPQVNVPRFLETGEIQLISADALEPHLQLAGDLITNYAAKKIRGLENPVVSFEGSEVRLEARYHHVPVSIAFSFLLKPSSLVIRLVHARAGFLPLPKILFSGLTDRFISLNPNDEVPFHLTLGSLVGAGSTLKVGT